MTKTDPQESKLQAWLDSLAGGPDKTAVIKCNNGSLTVCKVGKRLVIYTDRPTQGEGGNHAGD
jgi:hypothetical protein